MKKFALLFVSALSLSMFGLTGCGGGGEKKVIENTASDNEMSAQQQSSYEDYMKNQKQGPGN